MILNYILYFLLVILALNSLCGCDFYASVKVEIKMSFFGCVILITYSKILSLIFNCYMYISSDPHICIIHLLIFFRRGTFVAQPRVFNPAQNNNNEPSPLPIISDQEFGPPPPNFAEPNGNQFQSTGQAPHDYRFSVGQLPGWAKKQVGFPSGCHR